MINYFQHCKGFTNHQIITVKLMLGTNSTSCKPLNIYNKIGASSHSRKQVGLDEGLSNSISLDLEGLIISECWSERLYKSEFTWVVKSALCFSHLQRLSFKYLVNRSEQVTIICVGKYSLDLCLKIDKSVCIDFFPESKNRFVKE